jgi:hypothetical protein
VEVVVLLIHPLEKKWAVESFYSYIWEYNNNCKWREMVVRVTIMHQLEVREYRIVI